jgi:catechol 2,3-dioxygenase
VSSFHQPPTNFISSVTLNVHDRKRMVDFYRWLGFRILQETNQQTILGTDRPVLVLKHDQPYVVEQQNTQGLYHVAFLLPTREELGSVLRYLIQQRYPLQGLSDHGVSEAIYLTDPEDNGIELYVDRPKDQWPYQLQQLAMVTEPMKYQEVLSLAKPYQKFSNEVVLGHLHLHVSNLAEAVAYYQSTLRYEVIQYYGESAAFLSSGGYHHHLGLNTWRGQHLPKKNLNTTGIVAFHVQSIHDHSVVNPTRISIFIKKSSTIGY